jgi:carboxypeptidase PM20D1
MALVIVLVILLFLFAFLLVRTVAFGRPIPPVEAAAPLEIDSRRAAEHLSRVLRCTTVSVLPDSDSSYLPFDELHRELETLYPKLHLTLPLKKIAGYSLLYTWAGSNPELEPVLLAAHQDVVPAPPDTLAQWEYPPFSGEISDGFIWGRGALDIKNQMVAVMDAVEYLLERGYQPERTIYLAFGHDEEIGGAQGAAQIAAWLQERGERLAAVLDEGGSLVEGVFPGVNVPVALIGTGEKGYLTLSLTAEGTPGHSSTPPAHTPIGILAQAITRVEGNPMPAHLSAIAPMLRAIAPDAPLSQQFLFANLWLFGGLVRGQLLRNPKTAATLRTTAAVTIIQGGMKDNVIPAHAEARINLRLLPGDSIASVCEFVRRVVKDEQVHIEAESFSAHEATALSPTTTPVYQSLALITRRIFGSVPVSPYLVLGATDARHYTGVCDNIFRFSPVVMASSDLDRMHGLNERIAVEDLANMVRFYVELMKVWGKDFSV